jgi:GT2 family glycosyltransferase
VQFVDGDCEVCPGWLETARAELERQPQLGVVCGRRRERHPEASVYNRLCDIEWDTPVGEARACGGDALMRVDAVDAVGGYDPGVIAAEDDELCLRLRRAGWAVRRIDADMTVHDAAMTRAKQWWKRAERCGYAYANGAALHGRGPERHFVRESRRVLFWGAALPALAVLLAVPTLGLSLLLLGLYPVQFAKVYRAVRGRVPAKKDAAAYATSCVLAKFPEAVGMARFAATRLRRKPARIIEYK